MFQVLYAIVDAICFQSHIPIYGENKELYSLEEWWKITDIYKSFVLEAVRKGYHSEQVRNRNITLLKVLLDIQ